MYGLDRNGGELRVARMEVDSRRVVLLAIGGLAAAAISFWITLGLIDYGFWGVLHKTFP